MRETFSGTGVARAAAGSAVLAVGAGDPVVAGTVSLPPGASDPKLSVESSHGGMPLRILCRIEFTYERNAA